MKPKEQAPKLYLQKWSNCGEVWIRKMMTNSTREQSRIKLLRLMRGNLLLWLKICNTKKILCFVPCIKCESKQSQIQQKTHMFNQILLQANLFHLQQWTRNIVTVQPDFRAQDPWVKVQMTPISWPSCYQPEEALTATSARILTSKLFINTLWRERTK